MFLEKMNPVAKKSLFAIITAILFVTLILLIYYLETPGKIFGIITFTILGILALYEFCHPFNIPKWAKFIIPLTTIFIILTPFNETFIEFINTPNSELTSLNPESPYADILVELIRDQFNFSVSEITGIGFPVVGIMILVPCLFSKERKKIIPNFFALLIGTILITFSLKILFYLLILQFSLTVTLISSVIIVDILGYFGGKFFGNKIFKRKLAPKISPNKTIEGAIIGHLVSAAFLFLIFWLNFLQIPGGVNFGKLASTIDPVVLLITIPFFTPIIAILGDLLFSFVKRKLQIKDFSNLIPSHGGFLDRFDSLILVLFVFGIFICFA
ncbi:MAG: phosphatidate cytidylyltransferase [Metamycoplasmataceae bacterium]